MAKTMTTYEAENILGLTGTYNRKQVRAAYRKLAMTYHPDHASNNGIDNEEAKRRMQEVNAAYDRLEQYFTVNNVETVTAANKTKPSAEADYFTTRENSSKEKMQAEVDAIREEEARKAAEKEPVFTPEEVAWHIEFYERSRKREAEAKKKAEEAAKAREAEENKSAVPTRRVMDWNSILVAIVTFFPYRLAFLFGAIFLQKALTGIDLFMGPQGLVPNPGTDLFVWLACFILLMVSILNLFVPFVTVHIQSKLLDLVER